MQRRLVDGELTIVADDSDPSMVLVHWQGKSNARQPSTLLEPYFRELALHARSHNLGIEMHFEQVEHFNSSTVTAIIRLIQVLRMNGIKLRLTYDPRMRWQKISLDALKIFERSDDLFEVVEVEGSALEPEAEPAAEPKAEPPATSDHELLRANAQPPQGSSHVGDHPLSN